MRARRVGHVVISEIATLEEQRCVWQMSAGIERT